MIDKEIQDLLTNLIQAQLKTDAQLAKTDAQLAKSDSKLERLAEMYGGVSNNQGIVAEEFFYNSLKVKPVLNGISFDSITKNVTRKVGDVEEEYDIILVNGTFVYLIEVKYRLHTKYIERFLERKLPHFLILFPEYKNMRIHVVFASFAIQDEVLQFLKEKDLTLLYKRGEVFETMVA